MADKNKTVDKGNSGSLLSRFSRFFIHKKDKEINISSREYTPREDELKKDETELSAAPEKKKSMSVVRAAAIAFCIIYLWKVISLNAGTFDHMFGYGVLEELRPIIFFGGAIVILILLTKVSVNVFGKEKTYNSYLPMAIFCLIILFLFKGCMWFLENWGGGY